MSFKQSSLWPLSTLLMLVVCGAAIAGAKFIIDRRDATISQLSHSLSDLRVEVKRLSDENNLLANQIESQLAEISDLSKQMDTSMMPQEVGAPADFPIMRGMARHGDSVASFAKREGTDTATVLALNPWLEENTSLKQRQLLWIPKNQRLTGRNGALKPDNN